MPTLRTPVAEAALHIGQAVGDGEPDRAWRRVLQVAADLTSSDPALKIGRGAAEAIVRRAVSGRW